MRAQLCFLAVVGAMFMGAGPHSAADEPRPAAPSTSTSPSTPASCNLDLGRRVFTQCSICHSLTDDPAVSAGPQLRGVVGRRPASMPGFAYSPALQSFGQNLGKPWTPEEMDTFLTQPALRVPGTAMAFAGLKKPEQRAAVICYIEQTAR